LTAQHRTATATSLAEHVTAGNHRVAPHELHLVSSHLMNVSRLPSSFRSAFHAARSVRHVPADKWFPALKARWLISLPVVMSCSGHRAANGHDTT